MRDAYIPKDSLVLIELDPVVYNTDARERIASYIKQKFKAQPVIVTGHERGTTINVLMPAESVSDASS
jgi:hypothetical protein